MGDGIRLRADRQRRTYVVQVAVPPDLHGRVVGARGQPVKILERPLRTSDHREAKARAAKERADILAMFADVRRGLLAAPAELVRIAEAVGRDSYDQLAARYLTGRAEIETIGIEIKRQYVLDMPDRPNPLLHDAMTLAYAERKLTALGAKPAPDDVSKLADLILGAQQRAIEAIEKGIHLPAMSVPAPSRVGHGPRLSDLENLYTADRKGELSAKSLKHIPPAFAGLRQFAGDVPIDSIDRSTVSNWIRELAERLQPSSVNRTLHVMSGVWMWCVDHGRIRADTPSPFTRLARRVDPARTKYVPFEIEELQKLIEPSPIRQHILVGLYSGMRCGEVTRSKLVKVSGVLCFEIGSGKTDAAARRVPVHPALVAAGVADWHKSLSKYLGDTVSKRFIRWRRSCGITHPKKVLHSLRSNFTTALEAANVPQSTAKLLVGHKRRDMTYGHYSSGPGLKTLAAAVAKVSYKGLRL